MIARGETCNQVMWFIYLNLCAISLSLIYVFRLLIYVVRHRMSTRCLSLWDQMDKIGIFVVIRVRLFCVMSVCVRVCVCVCLRVCGCVCGGSIRFSDIWNCSIQVDSELSWLFSALIIIWIYMAKRGLLRETYPANTGINTIQTHIQEFCSTVLNQLCH